ncbi:iron complex transport system permease protein [Actinoplanes campanulatus]|uniref:Iron complex transport system permease protein n=1 Tax=Actinoplanes campanulatus TaxID=113559 RepID=A0A7W5AE10_9ACTN|nr:iron chelate uptake ABC transporter family permease subunit [Actinoplanes campanulatus]MBB3094607.1 iron complex transport system permease protein [Actinoplanes campanulatus]GGN22255.1 iron ABC transporter permease [Actinoplanes campanulatus]GID35476.1 iron ABC transporter permease [Actinoplanes campanulatus]
MSVATLDTLRVTRRRRSVRSITVTTVLALLVAALFVLTMMVGSFRLTAGQVIVSVLHLEPNPGIDFVVRGLRLPTAGAGLAVGLALGASGTVFQQLLRNPLASPDFVGVTSGASLAAVGGIVFLQAAGLAVCAYALGGALLAALLMYVLAWRDGVSGYRFILIGIGVAAFFDGLIGYVLSRARLTEARQAMHWLTGSVGQASESELRILLYALPVLLPVAVLLQRHLRALELGDDTARALGTRTELSRAALLGTAVLLVALAVAVAGPIVFVALVAGPVANRLLGPATGGIAAAALTGAALLLTADLVAVHLMPSPLPTGVVTGAVGAPYLLWLLATTNRRGAGG